MLRFRNVQENSENIFTYRLQLDPSTTIATWLDYYPKAIIIYGQSDQSFWSSLQFFFLPPISSNSLEKYQERNAKNNFKKIMSGGDVGQWGIISGWDWRNKQQSQVALREYCEEEMWIWGFPNHKCQK